jgi:hypothetical protein
MEAAPATRATRPEFIITKSWLAPDDWVGDAAPLLPLPAPLAAAVTEGSGKAFAPLGMGLGRMEAEAP